MGCIKRSNISHDNYQKISINGIAQLMCSLNIFLELHEYAT